MSLLGFYYYWAIGVVAVGLFTDLPFVKFLQPL